MKTNSLLASALTLISLCARGQVSPPLLASGPVSVEAGPHHRVWQRVTVDNRGRAITNSYTELATGLNFLDSATGLYESSQEEFRTTKYGRAGADKGQHQVTLSADINSGGAVELITHDGPRRLCNPMGLSFRDARGRNGWLAVVTICLGE